VLSDVADLAAERTNPELAGYLPVDDPVNLKAGVRHDAVTATAQVVFPERSCVERRAGDHEG
jgi:hypothetical protein